eukprot:TRINITY_DN638_c0_g1_i2.p1 TRINITY_DN638_c0_g1~~TRINITY_DN638_c0_g1_i2.p1  ORF type:complete len:158 (+),score=19.24 TRINITY_DN638_c0_g1_i2:308-781(+)
MLYRYNLRKIFPKNRYHKLSFNKSKPNLNLNHQKLSFIPTKRTFHTTRIALHSPSCTSEQPMFDMLTKEAQEGDRAAQFQLGEKYFLGSKEVKQDFNKALEWLLKAGEAGHIKAFYYLSMIYSNGLGVDVDMAQATKWVQLSVDHGIVSRLLILAML